MQLYAIALAPGLLVLLYMVVATSFSPSVKGSFVMAFLLGMAGTLPAIAVQLYTRERIGTSMLHAGPLLLAFTAFVTVALSEEGSKFLVLRFYAYPLKSFNGPLAAMAFSLLVATGFASIEQLGYASRNGIHTALLRTLITLPAHLVFGVIMGYYAGKAKTAPNPLRQLAAGLLLAILCHGCFDFILFLQQAAYLDEPAARLLLYTVITLSTAFALTCYRRALRYAKQYSNPVPIAHSFQPANMNKPLELQLAGPEDIPVIRALAEATWPATYAALLSSRQIHYMMERIYSPAALETQMQQQHRFLLARDAGLPVGFASWSSLGKVAKLQKIYVLPNLHQKGVGKFLVSAVERLAKADGCSRLQLNVNRKNPARSFYERQGFVITREEDIPIGEGYFMNDYVMEKII